MPESRDRWLLSKIPGDNFFDREPVSGASLFKGLMMTTTTFLLGRCTRLSLLIIVKARDSQQSSFHPEDEGLEERGGLDRDQVRFENSEHEVLQRVDDGGAELARCDRCFSKGRYQEGLGHLFVHVNDQEPCRLGVIVSHWSVETHRFFSSLAQFTPTLEDV